MLKCDKCHSEAEVKVTLEGELFENGGDCWGYVANSVADPGHYCDDCFGEAEEESCSVSVRYGGK